MVNARIKSISCISGTLNRFVGTFDDFVDCQTLVAMNGSAALLSKSFDLFQIRSGDNNLSLGYLDDATIEVFEEKAALF